MNARATAADLVRLGLERTGRFRFRARGGSMRPVVRDGDVVLVVCADGDRLEIGDVICYEPEGGGLAVHRLVARSGTVLVTKGDALAWVDRIPVDRVLGLVVATERRRRLAGWLGRVGRGLRHAWSILWHA